MLDGIHYFVCDIIKADQIENDLRSLNLVDCRWTGRVKSMTSGFSVVFYTSLHLPCRSLKWNSGVKVMFRTLLSIRNKMTINFCGNQRQY